MNKDQFKLCEGFIGKSYASQAVSSRNTREKLVKALLSNRCIPDDSWDDETINLFLSEMSVMDSNNFVDKIGIGEREARIFCDIVCKRHFSLGHGIGRSGDITAIQPKAAGSSLIYQLTMQMMKSLIKKDIKCIKNCLIFPMATGMAIVMTLLTIKQRLIKERKLTKSDDYPKYILWPRIDQKTCLKAMITAGFEVIVLENIYDTKSKNNIINNDDGGKKSAQDIEVKTNSSNRSEKSPNRDELRTDLKTLESEIIRLKPENILCILSTSSCFAPRAPDNIIEISKLCKKYNIYNVINNAYGLQSIQTCNLIQRCHEVGRLDVIVQSTDKNFMVPVGGSIVASTDATFITELSAIYPGRASMSPILDVFITLLKMGANTWHTLRVQQIENYFYCKALLSYIFDPIFYKTDDTQVANESLTLLELLCAKFNLDQNDKQFKYLKKYCPQLVKFGFPPLSEISDENDGNDAIFERVLDTPHNPISIGLTLNSLLTAPAASDATQEPDEAKSGVEPQEEEKFESDNKRLSELGAMLFSRCVTGARIVVPSKSKKIGSFMFEDYGGHVRHGYHSPYITVAAAIGMEKNEIHTFIFRLIKCYAKLKGIKDVKKCKNMVRMKRYVRHLNGAPNVDSIKISGMEMKELKIEKHKKNERKAKGKERRDKNKKSKKDKDGKEKRDRKRKSPVNVDSNARPLRYTVFGVAFGIFVTLLAVNSQARVERKSQHARRNK